MKSTSYRTLGRVRRNGVPLRSRQAAKAAPYARTLAIGIAFFAAVCVSAFGPVSALGQQVIYVDADATGANDGTSWSNACVSLQDALVLAAGGLEIWVAEGTYLPDDGTGDVYMHFRIPPRVRLLGGFSGSETRADERDPELHVTVLSGEIGDPNRRADNSAQVLNTSYTDRKTIVDGFTITRGGAYHSPPAPMGGIVNENGSPTLRNLRIVDNDATNDAVANGGGMRNYGGDPLLENVVFAGNFARRDGGLLNENGSPELRNVQFLYNTGWLSGGGMTSYGDSQPILENVLFHWNTAAYHAEGGAFISDSQSHPTLRNVIFSENRAIQLGGSCGAVIMSSGVLENVHFYGNVSEYGGALCAESPLTIVNVSFLGNKTKYGNNAAISGSGITVVNGLFAYNESEGPIAGDNTFVNSTFAGNIATNASLAPLPCATYRNSIIWGNAVDTTCTTRIGHSIIEGGIPYGAINEGGNICSEPLFADPDGPDDIPGNQDDDFRLLSGSPGIDIGSNDLIPPDIHDLDKDGDTTEPTPFDLDGNERVISGTVDRGPYESTGPLPVVLTSFDAVTSHRTITLRWQTASAEGVAGFVVQRLLSTDEPMEIDYVTAVNSDETVSYSHRVTDLWPGAYTYRLKIVDLDGSVAYSSDVTASIILDAPFLASAVYPNPMRDRGTITLSVREPQEVTVEVFDVAGRQVGILFAGALDAVSTKTIHVDASSLPDGVYFCRVRGSRFATVEKMVVVR